MDRLYTVKFRLKTFIVSDSRPSRKPTTPTRSSEEIAELARLILQELDIDKEHFLVLCLNNKNRLNGFKVVSTGSLTASLVHPREVFRAALELDAAAVVFVHNHPSGDPAPSPEDREITRRLMEIAGIMGIRGLDHVILGDGKHFSFNDRGML